MKLCKDCKHLRYIPDVPSIPHCVGVVTKEVDYFNGKVEYYRHPRWIQKERQSGTCGPEGTLWEPKV